MYGNLIRASIAATLLAIGVATPRAEATLILPGQEVAPNAQANPLTGTTILADTGVQNYNVALAGSQIIGTGQAWVVSGFSGNTFGAGALTFVYQVALTGGTTPFGTTPVLARITTSAFDGYGTDVGYSVVTAGQVIPPGSTRSANGNVVSFDFAPPAGTGISVGQTTALLIVNTNARSFVPGTLTVQNGLTANVNGFSPTPGLAPAPIPEPSTMALAGIGATLLFGVRWRRGRRPLA